MQCVHGIERVHEPCLAQGLQQGVVVSTLLQAAPQVSGHLVAQGIGTDQLAQGQGGAAGKGMVGQDAPAQAVQSAHGSTVHDSEGQRQLVAILLARCIIDPARLEP